MKTLLDKINLNQIDDQLFDTTAEQIAQAFGTPYKVEKNNRTKEPKDANKSSQIRRFYEDLLNWKHSSIEQPARKNAIKNTPNYYR